MKLRLVGLLVLVLFSSCDRYLFSERMLRIPKGFEYSKFEDIIETEYRIAPDDKVAVRLFTNDGSGLINIQTGPGVLVGGGTSFGISIESDGFAKLPLFGRVYLSGLTIRQAEMLIEDKYSEFYNNPFVLLEVSNKRVMIFAGSNTSVVPLLNDNTTLFEVLASTGGIPADGKAHNIRLIRGDLKNPEVYKIDLSTLSGMKNANLVLQANDIIYIDVRKGYVRTIMSEIAPYLSVLTTIVTTSAIITQLQRLGQ
ncbi:MAG: polysaccharide biosynthesis/export family protein [Flavobacteriales bacterium]|nr:polysaccharide biosynthesis/export family protein [Flavobacteriales bacterium]